MVEESGNGEGGSEGGLGKTQDNVDRSRDLGTCSGNRVQRAERRGKKDGDEGKEQAVTGNRRRQEDGHGSDR